MRSGYPAFTGRRLADNRVDPLAGLIFCGACKGKMTGQFSPSSQKRYYRCRSYDWDVQCPQRQVQAEPIEEQLGQMLMAFELPKEWQDRSHAALDELLNQKQTRDRIEEIKQLVERLDMRRDMGVMSKEEYLQKRSQLQEELQGAQPLPREHLEQALKLFRDFRMLWEGGNPYERKHLLGLVVEKVWVWH